MMMSNHSFAYNLCIFFKLQCTNRMSAEILGRNASDGDQVTKHGVFQNRTQSTVRFVYTLHYDVCTREVHNNHKYIFYHFIVIYFYLHPSIDLYKNL